MNEKESGVIMHITSLPSKYGIGGLGKEAYKFIDYIKECGFSYWEILPLEDVGFSNSPFQVITAFGLNPLLIDIDDLIEQGLVNSRDLQNLDFGENPRKVDFEKVTLSKDIVFKKAFKRFDLENKEYLEFKKDSQIFKYCLFKIIKLNNGNKAWFDYSLEDRYYDEEVMVHYLKHHSKEIEYQYFLQFVFIKQWNKLHEYAKSKNIEIIGDIPHFLGFDSDEMYFNPELFMVDKRNLVTYVAGYPADNFNSRGQKWGYPLYDWEYMRLNNYKWWRRRLYRASSLYDRVKLNHFRGFKEVYAIPFRSKNPKKGVFMDGPGIEFVNLIKEENNLIASGLGNYSLKIRDFIKESDIPYNITLIPTLFDDVEDIRRILPSEIDENTYFYLGNHDNTPIKVKLDEISEVKKEELLKIIKEECIKLNVSYLEDAFSNYDIAFKLIELIFASKAEHVSFTFQDLFFKGKESRMNRPSTLLEDNWTYRFLPFEFNNDLKNKIFSLNEKYCRLNVKNNKK